MKKNLKTLIVSIAIPLIVGGISGFISRGSREAYALLNKPALSPPGWLFPVVWTTLFILMGIASYLVVTSEKSQNDISNALTVYVIQLMVNFFWSIFFFNFERYLFSFLWILLLWLLILLTILLFYRVSKPAAYIMIPYFLWVTFAGYLNLSVYLLN